MDTITITATGGNTFDVAASAPVPVFQPVIDAGGDIGGLTTDGAGPRVVTQAAGGPAVAAALPAGAVNVSIVGIDGAGAVYGTYWLPDATGGPSSYITYSFKDAGGAVATIAGPNGAAGTVIGSVNAAGTVAGFYTDADSLRQAFLLSGTDATPVTIDGSAPGTIQSLAPIDAAGDVAGIYSDASGSPQLFLATGGSAAAASVPLTGAFTPMSLAAVRDGVMTGTVDNGGQTYGFYILDGATNLFNAPVGARGGPQPLGFDADGNVVGTYTDGSGQTQSFTEAVAPDGSGAWQASPLAFPGPGVLSTAVTGIDGAGNVFGTYTDSSGAAHGFVERGGTFTAVPVPDGVDLATPTGADAAGDVVGFTTSYTRETGSAAFVDRGGAGALLTVAGQPLPDVAHGAGIVDGLGRIIGTVSDTTSTHAFVAGPGSTATFDAAPGARSTSIDATDAAGDVAGSYLDAQNQGRVYLRTADGTVTRLDPAASAGASFVGMNAAGAVAFTYYDDDGDHAALYAGGKLTTITPDGAISSDAAFIDAAGDVFGSFDDGAGTHLFERAADGTVTRLDPAGAEYAGDAFFDAAGDAAGTYEVATGGGIVTLVGGKLSTTSLTAPLGASRVDSVALDAAGGAYGIYEQTGRYDTHAFYQPVGGAPVRIDPTTDISVDHNTLLSGGGTVAGTDIEAKGYTYIQQVYVYADGTTTTYDAPINCSVALAGIDARGDVAGTFTPHGPTKLPQSIAFVITAGGLSALAPPSDVDAHGASSVSGITDSGLVAGTYTGADGYTHLFTAQAGSSAATRLDPEGSTGASFVFGAGGAPVVANYTDGSGASHGLIDLGGRVTVVDGAPGATSTTLTSVDAQGNITGTYTDAAGTHAFVSFAAATPTITGTHASSTTTGTPIQPFGGVTIGDGNANATETLTIVLSGAGGSLSDGTGYSGLRPEADGSYTLTGTAEAVTDELDALAFTPAAPGTTSFALKDVTSVGGVFTNTATDATTNTAVRLAPPTVTGDAATPATGDTTVGQVLTFTLTMSEAVTVTGTPTLTLSDGGTASYTGLSPDGRTLTFTGTVQPGQNATNLRVTGTDLPNGATIRDAAGNDAVLTGAKATFTGLNVDTTAPTVMGDAAMPATGDTTVGQGLTFTLTTSEAVTVVGTPTLTLSDGGTASYTGLSPDGRTLTFTGTVQPGQNATNLRVTGADLNGATIRDAAGNDAVLTGAKATFTGLNVDTTAPTVTGDAATPATGDTTVGQGLTFTLTMSEAVTVVGTPTLTLSDGGTASYTGLSPDGRTLTFTGTVQPGQNATNLRVTGTDLPNGATIRDAAGNDAVLTGAKANFTGLNVDTTAPLTASPTLTVAQNASATPIGIAAPSDNLSAAGSLAIVAGTLPSDGIVTLADGITRVTAGESLTLAQLTGLTFTPTPGAFSQTSTFTYNVTDDAGNASQGTAALSIGPGAPTIAGTGATTTAHQAPLSPFASVTVNDPNGGSTTDTVMITLSGALGTLAGSGLVANTDGSYSLASASPATLTSELQALTFAPLVSDMGPVEATGFTLTVTSSAGTTASEADTTYTVDSTPNQGLFGTTATGIDSPVGEIFALYEGLLGRAPDQVGAEQWLARLAGGKPLDQVTQGLLSSGEGASNFTVGSSDADFVNQLYERVLGRAGEAAGVTYWNNQLAAGESRADVADGFVFSQEHTMDLQPALSHGVFIADDATSETARLYYGLLDRAPDAGGLQANTQGLDNGLSIQDLAQSFLTSPEYQSHDANLTNAQFVTDLYRNALDRAPDATGGQGWINALNGGSSRADVAIGIVESAEVQGHLAGRIENGFHLA